VFTVRGENTMETCQVDSGLGYQGNQPGDGCSCASLRPRHTVHPVHNIQRFKYDMRSAGLRWVRFARSARSALSKPISACRCAKVFSAHNAPCRCGLVRGVLRYSYPTPNAPHGGKPTVAMSECSRISGDSRSAWRVLLAGFYGLPLDV
jgi:hypothetical protein